MSTNKIIASEYLPLDSFIHFVQSDLAPKRTIPIYLFNNSYPPCYGKSPHVLYNCEQLTRPLVLDNCIRMIETYNPVEIQDYSQANIDILHSRGIQATLVPIESPQSYIDKLIAWRKDSILYDFGICCASSDRRLSIIGAIQRRGYSFLVLTNVWGDERDKQLARCRILMNIHYGDTYNVFESARCEPWLKVGVPVISETSLDNDPRCISVDYDRLVETAISTLERIKNNL